MNSDITNYSADYDAAEIKDWLEALAGVVNFASIDRAGFILNKLAEALYKTNYHKSVGSTTSYRNTLATLKNNAIAADLETADKCSAILRWNAAAIVLRAGKVSKELGGHIATYASVATLYEVGFDYFFKGPQHEQGSDLIYYQGHSIPGVYARAFLEGRLSESQLQNFRQEVDGNGLPSYPHPWSMPEFWQFPTVSMGLGAITAIYQARFLRYLENRRLVEASSAELGRKVWVFCGDGEMDEPESLGAISIAAREKLDNLIFVINCNLQRLDGPVRGNGKIIQELEGIFRGAGWRVIKVLWGREWDQLFALDHDGLFQTRLDQIVDGDMQRFCIADVSQRRKMLFANCPKLESFGSQFSDEVIASLAFGGHDREQIYTAYDAAVKHTGQPVVILAQSVKGYGLGKTTEAMNTAHQQKTIPIADLVAMKNKFDIPLTDQDISDLKFYMPKPNSKELRYLKNKRENLGGSLPARISKSSKLEIPELSYFSSVLADTAGREISTTMAFVRILSLLLRDKNIKDRIVPIVPDESRTFGMEGLFRQIGIYSAVGQQYDAVDKEQIMCYKESITGQLLEEGINEGGAFASWIAAATSYSSHNTPVIPFYIYYSMFGFQRTGDFAWCAGDARARGFLLGATSGRTTLAGEGLQHTDGHSHVLSSTVPNCKSYDPTYAYEVAVIIAHGMQRMYADNIDEYYYITLTNENYAHPAMPKGAEEGIIKGMYQLKASTAKNADVVLLGSGAILREVEAAAVLLQQDFSISADIWSVTSFTELKRDAERTCHYNMHNIMSTPKSSYVTESMAYHTGPVVAATDYMRSYADQIRPYLSHDYHVLGTDGFGRSDTRAKLRKHFEVDSFNIAYTAIYALFTANKLNRDQLQKAYKMYKIDADKAYSLDS
jgi:pyruvate dehydrogenase E1 component